jgi:nucleotide-binding universal stress UspA family protein
MDKTLRILAALDGAAGSESVLHALTPLSRLVRLEFTMLQVVGRADDVADARSYLVRLASRLNLTAEKRVEVGHAAEVIRSRLHSGLYDFGALATHGRRGLSRLLTGSVAEDVLSGAEVPLLIQRPNGRVGDWEEIVVALDGSTEAEEILDPIGRFASMTGARLHLAGVMEVPVTTLPIELTYGAVTMPDLQPYLESVRRRLADQALRLRVQPLRGMPAASLVRYAADIGAGMIAMTTLGKTGIRRVIMGSVAQRVMRTAPCPLLIQRTRQEASLAQQPVARKRFRPGIRGFRPMPGWATRI